MPRTRPPYPPAFRAEAVRLIRSGHKPLTLYTQSMLWRRWTDGTDRPVKSRGGQRALRLARRATTATTPEPSSASVVGSGTGVALTVSRRT